METYFKMGQLPIRISQVCGQCDQKRWKYFFEDVTTILFYASLCDYNKLVFSDSGQTRLAKSLVLFETILNSRWFLRSSIVLFLSEVREFKAKLPEEPLVDYFPEYTGGTDVNKGAKYILRQFMQVHRAQLNVYPHITDFFDRSTLELIFVNLKQRMVQNSLRDAGIL
ncbi:guanine nucleotide binding protein, alpha subunit [Russula compacta]|nr:guanine nucleotide binding protein, alpha subunit [Russula compacta]